jgi:cell wall-associated NlpC family hydrolase
MTERAHIIAAAKDWLETPFHHQARLKGVGVDCIGLVIGVARELGLVDAGFDVTGYPRVPDGKSLMELARQHMQPIAREAMQPGDVVVVAFDKDPQHFGILGNYTHGGLSIIHAAGNVGRVIETRLMFTPSMRFVAAFVLSGVN